jgi:hypothetical protein
MITVANTGRRTEIDASHCMVWFSERK